MRKEIPKTQQLRNLTSHALISYKEVEDIFGACPLEGTISRKKAIYINEARRSNYPIVLIGSPLFSSRSISFMEVDAYIVHFSHNNALILTMHIHNCRVSRILVDSESSVNILYKRALDRMEDTLEIARAMIVLKLGRNWMGLIRTRLVRPTKSLSQSALIRTMSSRSSM